VFVNMNKPTVSVLTVTRNVERFLPECIESILAQTFTDFEFVIVDFGSSDNSKSIISHYAATDSRIKFHIIPGCGLAEARNAGCFLAQGRYIAIMDADDVSVPNRLRWGVEFMEKHPEVGVVGGAVEWINSAGQPLMIAHHPSGDQELQSALLTHSVLWQPTVLIRGDAFALVGGYRNVFAQAEDYDLWLRIAERFQIANLEQVVLRYRIHPHQVSLRKRTQQTLGILAAQASASARRHGKPDPLDSVKEITPTLLAGLGIPEDRQKRELARHYQHWITHMYRAGEYAVALDGALALLQPPQEHVERRQKADLYFMVARLWLKQKKLAKGFLAMGRAVITWPIVVVDILESLLRQGGWMRLMMA
jgi:GT2 family glycosyltransferase